MNKIFSLSKPLFANFEIFGGCNQKCVFCYNSSQIKRDKIPSKKDVFQILERLRELDIFQVNLLGGEPTLIPYFDEILRYGSELGLFLGFATNGLQLSDSLCQIMKKYEIEVGLSIHGVGVKHDQMVGKEGAFSKTQESLKLLEKNQIPSSVVFVVTKSNHTHFPELYKLLEHKFSYVKTFYLNRFIPAGSSKNRRDLEFTGTDINEIADLARKIESSSGPQIFFGDCVPLCVIKKANYKFIKQCTVGSDYIVVDIKGNGRLCVNSNRSIGNIFIQEIEDIWGSEYLEEYRTLNWLSDKCKECDLLLQCRGGCHFSNPNTNEYTYNNDYLLDVGESNV